MDYTKLQYGPVQQSEQLAYRQAKADQNSAPQTDEGTLTEACIKLVAWEYDQDLDGSSQEQGR